MGTKLTSQVVQAHDVVLVTQECLKLAVVTGVGSCSQLILDVGRQLRSCSSTRCFATMEWGGNMAEVTMHGCAYGIRINVQSASKTGADIGTIDKVTNSASGANLPSISRQLVAFGTVLVTLTFCLAVQSTGHNIHVAVVRVAVGSIWHLNASQHFVIASADFTACVAHFVAGTGVVDALAVTGKPSEAHRGDTTNSGGYGHRRKRTAQNTDTNSYRSCTEYDSTGNPATHNATNRVPNPAAPWLQFGRSHLFLSYSSRNNAKRQFFHQTLLDNSIILVVG